MTAPTAPSPEARTSPYLTPADVEREFGFSRTHLAQMRFHGEGPRYRKPTPRKVLYRRADIIDWIEASARQGTAAEAS
ncbi:hypothetical protein FBY40_1606 [Microbacterium sp. SLBN-154]|uniref:helix-turn-helix transcriptional regulator n=1 Tax=Microbacterium sp. SLBN-154 TaxID=2768458 RepID=UPI001151E4CE|nr:helix-turn-helix domain-containing protein [Microbacterium sp. SLBN-154]TQK19115.1 hypothetical protein FBY40_1606 [Microbacterium sp. SLBN-154]